MTREEMTVEQRYTIMGARKLVYRDPEETDIIGYITWFTGQYICLICGLGCECEGDD